LSSDAGADSIEQAGVEADLTQKGHKVAVVATLLNQGVFQIRESVEFVAAQLGVAEFTIYNYFKEIEER
jgi:predicted transcriptional regulator YheO